MEGNESKTRFWQKRKQGCGAKSKEQKINKRKMNKEISEKNEKEGNKCKTKNKGKEAMI